MPVLPVARLTPTHLAVLLGAALAAAPLTGHAQSAQAAAIPTVFGTGVAADGTTLPNGSVDPHYTAYNWATLGTLGTLIGQARTLNNGYQPTAPGQTYAYSATSRYVWSSAAGNDNDPHNVAFRTTFDLTGFNLASVVLNGSMSADNHVYGVFLNGVQVGSLGTNTFTSFTSYTINSGFTSGLNTLDFYATNDSGPAGFDTDLSGQGSPSAGGGVVPEPSTWALLGSGLVGLAGVGARRRRMATG